MASFMLAQLQLKFGPENLARYSDAMSLVRKLFEDRGIRLRNGMISRTGRLYEAWNLWEIEDHGHLARALAQMSGDPDLPRALHELASTVEHEDIRILDSLPFA